MLQDTGYPTEVYLPPGSSSSPAGPDYNDLRERWVGWAVEYVGSDCCAFAYCLQAARRTGMGVWSTGCSHICSRPGCEE